MITKELIQAEIDNMTGDDLQELYNLIKQFVWSKRQTKKPSLMSKLKSISIKAPADFAVNHDLYVVGEKRAESNPG
ncbi:MAG TPA: hypothetical protein VJ793_22655 [Anaerolineae bacterium]|nr:hypothetical protein [Anaerolineae bacterium]